MKKPIKFLFLLVFAVAIGFVVKFKLAESSTVEGHLTLYGNVDIRQVALGFRTGGRVTSMAFEEGDAVMAGQVMASLDKGPLQDSLALFKAQVGVAEAAVAKLEAGTRPGEIAQVNAVVDERKIVLTNAEKLLHRQVELAKSGAGSKQAADDSIAQYDPGKSGTSGTPTVRCRPACPC